MSKAITYDEHGNYTSENSIALIWCIDDVKHASKDLGLERNLTDDECMEVLIHCQENLDWGHGFGWDNLHWTIQEFYQNKGEVKCQN